ncbi:PREDICTED: uncharacterized protein LOC108763156 [Trachymyrmex cornetzi]|uniref:uncharacterized protein LOC108763156 n=1 Tax=Trachymyrmex cornetzi TaxID=471704 RepID=UPI00084EF898|nr:PREDICTED: uncharacterized protein LOC108763156 [Trachymyrmex cornetzi]
MSCKISQFSHITINSRVSTCQITAQCLVIPKITKDLPGVMIDVKSLAIPSTIKLADPQFSNPGQIDMLLGGEFFLQLLDQGKIDLGTNLPSLQNTKFGWIISGPIPLNVNTSRVMSLPTITALTCLYDQGENVNDQLTRFWEIDECKDSSHSHLSNEERQCENLFQATTSRDQNGRFIVRLPFRENKALLGESRTIAEKRLIHLERKLKVNERFRESYVAFMIKYIKLGHMSAVLSHCEQTHFNIYLPHHGVVQESQGDSKLRVVFDASAKTSSSVSLNETLMIGATLQICLTLF